MYGSATPSLFAQRHFQHTGSRCDHSALHGTCSRHLLSLKDEPVVPAPQRPLRVASRDLRCHGTPRLVYGFTYTIVQSSELPPHSGSAPSGQAALRLWYVQHAGVGGSGATSA